MWFNKKDFNFTNRNIIKERDIYGYVLPHASSKYTSNIYLDTLQFKPYHRHLEKVYILYYPSHTYPNVEYNNHRYYHEYFVVWKSLQTIFKDWWKLPNHNTIQFIGINMNNPNTHITKQNSLIIVSADFSHFLPMQKAIRLENKAAHSLCFKTQHSSQSVVDDMKQFNYLFKLFPELDLRWVGRTRSLSEPGVGYLSFLITKKHIPTNPDGFFITAYDKNMNQRECLGKWGSYSKQKLDSFLKHVHEQAITTSRLTNGKYKHIPVIHFSITYLYRDDINKFIRGLHGVKKHAFFLADVILENTYEDGSWIKYTDNKWKPYDSFNLKETADKLLKKANVKTTHQTNNTLYKCYQNYLTIN